MSYFSDVIITDSTGFDVNATPNCELRIIEPYRLVGTQFTGTTTDPNFWTMANVGSGVITQSGDILLDTAATANSSSTITTVRVARYVPACSNRFRSQITLGDTGATNNSRKWGAFDGTNGCYFELDGTTIYAVTLKDGTPTRVASTSWTNCCNLPTLTNCNTWEIYWNNKSVWFSINDTLAHKVTGTTATWTSQINLPIKISSTNTLGLGASHTIRARVAAIHRLGAAKTLPIYKHISGAATTICKYSIGFLHSVTVNSPGTLCTVVDNFTGSTPVIAVIDTNKTSGGVGQYNYDCPFFTGLTIITTGTGDVTVCYE